MMSIWGRGGNTRMPPATLRAYLSFFWPFIETASCPVRELTSPRDVQSASWQSASWRIREFSSYLFFCAADLFCSYLFGARSMRFCSSQNLELRRKRVTVGVSWREQTTDDEVEHRMVVHRLDNIIEKQRSSLFGPCGTHEWRQDTEASAWMTGGWMSQRGPAYQGWTWRSTATNDLRELELGWKDVAAATDDRQRRRPGASWMRDDSPQQWLWPPCVIGQAIIFYTVVSFFLFYSSPYLSGHRLDVYHTSTRGVALVRI